MRNLYIENDAKINKLKDQELRDFFEQLYIFSDSSVENWEALLMISGSEDNKKRKNLFNNMYKEIMKGSFLAKAMEKTKVFDQYAVSMISLAEQTGRVKEASKALVKYYEQKDKLAKQIKSAIAFPVFLIMVIAVIAVFLMIFVMPVFQKIFEQLGLVLNPFALRMLNIGENLSSYSFIILCVLLFLSLCVFIIKKTHFKISIKKFIAKNIKFFRKLSNVENTNKFAFSMHLMIKSQMDSTVSLELSKTIIDSDDVKLKIDEIIKNVNKGESLQNAIIESKIFKAKYNGIIVASLRGGKLDEMFKKISNIYEETTQIKMKRITEIIEPVSVTLLCLLVGSIIFSVLIPLIAILEII